MRCGMGDVCAFHVPVKLVVPAFPAHLLTAMRWNGLCVGLPVPLHCTAVSSYIASQAGASRLLEKGLRSSQGTASGMGVV